MAWDQAKSSFESTPPATRDRTLSTADEGSIPRTSLLDSGLAQLAGSQPREAVLRAYSAVAEALEAALRQADIEVQTADGDALALARAAESAGLTRPETTDNVMGLSVLHNLARHAPSQELSPARAYQYLAMADGALYSIAYAMRRDGSEETLSRAA